MRLVASRNPFLALALIVAMLFPMMMVEGAVVFDQQPHQEQGPSSIQPAHADTPMQDLKEVTAGTNSSEACHHVSADGSCSFHCSTGSCLTLFVDFRAQLFAKPESTKNSLHPAHLPDPLPGSIHRPPLASA